jgi:hypothetical protein
MDGKEDGTSPEMRTANCPGPGSTRSSTSHFTAVSAALHVLHVRHVLGAASNASGNPKEGMAVPARPVLAVLMDARNMLQGNPRQCQCLVPVRAKAQSSTGWAWTIGSHTVCSRAYKFGIRVMTCHIHTVQINAQLYPAPSLSSRLHGPAGEPGIRRHCQAPKPASSALAAGLAACSMLSLGLSPFFVPAGHADDQPHTRQCA